MIKLTGSGTYSTSLAETSGYTRPQTMLPVLRRDDDQNLRDMQSVGSLLSPANMQYRALKEYITYLST